MTADKHTLDLISESKLFTGIGPLQLAKLMEKATLKEFAPGTFMIKEGEYGHDLFWILQGNIQLLMKSEHEGFPPIPLGTMTKGDVLGELSFFGIGPRVASALVNEKTQVYSWKMVDCLELFSEHSKLGYSFFYNLGQILGYRLVAMNKEIRDSTQKLDVKLIQNYR
jgi:CRP-like cAMP-binding protein